MKWIPRYQGDSLEDRLSQAKIEYAAHKRQQKQAYQKAMKFSKHMREKKSPWTEKEIAMLDLAIITIRKYRYDNYFAWIEFNNK